MNTAGPDLPLTATQCAICRRPTAAVEIYSANLDASAFSARVFSARRVPDGRHYRIVRCRECGLVRSDPVLATHDLERLYEASAVDYVESIPNLRRTYAAEVMRLSRHGLRRESLLEIGCGNGFFLEEALELGFRQVRGVEPSTRAVQRADARIAAWIERGPVRPGLYSEASFDLVCMFQVLDHLPEPAETLKTVRHWLRPNGLLLCLNHDISALPARILAERSPIIDVEHTYLFDPSTMRRLLEVAGYRPLELRTVSNVHNLRHLVHLTPMPDRLRRTLLARLRGSLGDWRLSLRLGNMAAVATPYGER